MTDAWRWFSGGALLAASAALVGCGSGEAKQEVVVYTAVDRQHSEPILKRFTEETGIEVRPLYDGETAKTTGLVTRLLGEAQRPRCDVFWNNESAQTRLLAQRGLTAPYLSPEAEDLPEEFRHPEGLWTSIAVRARVVVYNTKLVNADEAPKSIFELTDPKWKGKAAVANPQFGTTRTHMAALFAALGAEKAQGFLSALKANDVRIVDGNAMVMRLVGAAHPDASPVLVGLTDTDDVLAGQAEGLPVEMILPDAEGPGALGTLVVPSSVSLIAGAPHPNEARRLIDYLVSQEVGLELPQHLIGYTPVRKWGEKAEWKAMKVDWAEVEKQLEPSSLWTREHFNP